VTVAPDENQQWNLWDEFPPPLPVEGGITGSGRMDDAAGGVGAALVRRMLERSSPGVAMRGRKYARAGQTVTLAIERGRLDGTIQGSDETPYAVDISCTVPESDRHAFIAALHRVLPGPVTSIPVTDTRALRIEIGRLRLLVDSPLTVRCTCPYRGVCKHLVALAYVAGERLDRSPVAVASILGVSDDDLAEPGPNPERAADAVTEVMVFDRRRHGRLATALAALERRAPPDADEILGRAARTVTPPQSVADALGLSLPDGDADVGADGNGHDESDDADE
jgi:SWIM zinc finger